MINLVSFSPTVREKGLGFMEPAAIKDMTELTLKYVVKDGKMPDIDSLYTNQFVGKIKLSDSEVQSAQAAVHDFTKYLS